MDVHKDLCETRFLRRSSNSILTKLCKTTIAGEKEVFTFWSQTAQVGRDHENSSILEATNSAETWYRPMEYLLWDIGSFKFLR